MALFEFAIVAFIISRCLIMFALVWLVGSTIACGPLYGCLRIVLLGGKPANVSATDTNEGNGMLLDCNMEVGAVAKLSANGER